MQIVHLPVTGCILSKKLLCFKIFAFSIKWKNRLPATNLKFLFKCWCRGKNRISCWNRKQMVGAKKWSKMKPMVENNLTTFFWSDMGTDFLTIDNFKQNVDATICSLICVAKNPNQVSSPVTGCIHRLPASFVIGRSPAHSFHADCAFAGHRLHF